MSKKTEIMKAMDECVVNACEQMKNINSEERFPNDYKSIVTSDLDKLKKYGGKV